MPNKHFNDTLFFTTHAYYLKREKVGGVYTNGIETYLCRCSIVFPQDTDSDVRLRTDSSEARYKVYIESVPINPAWMLVIDSVSYKIERVNAYSTLDKSFKELILTLSPENTGYL